MNAMSMFRPIYQVKLVHGYCKTLADCYVCVVAVEGLIEFCLYYFVNQALILYNLPMLFPFIRSDPK